MDLLPSRFVAAVALSCLAALGIPVQSQSVDLSKLPPRAGAADFRQHIRPILETACVSCHGEEKQKGGFRIDSREAMMKGGDNGSAVEIGKSGESSLIHYVARVVKTWRCLRRRQMHCLPGKLVFSVRGSTVERYGRRASP